MAAYAARYARAFEQVAVAAKLDPAAARQQLGDFAATLSSSHDLREILMNPSIASESKLRVLDVISGRLGMLPQVRNFVAVIMSHQRLGVLDEILIQYGAVTDSGANTTEVEITTSRSIDDEERRALETKAAELAGGQIRTTYHEDASLLGGAILRLGSTVYDGSLRGQLATMRQRLSDVRTA